jgi:hypothetical protein
MPSSGFFAAISASATLFRQRRKNRKLITEPTGRASEDKAFSADSEKSHIKLRSGITLRRRKLNTAPRRRGAVGRVFDADLLTARARRGGWNRRRRRRKKID